MEIKVADVAELVDARDLKSLDGNVVWVRVPPPAPSFARGASEGCPAEACGEGGLCGHTLRLGKPRPSGLRVAPPRRSSGRSVQGKGTTLQQIRPFEMRRLEMLSNTIFGVAMTLLAYDLPKASTFAKAPDWIDLVRAYAQPLIALMISFIVAGVFWFSHHRRLAVAPEGGRGEVFLNLIFLLSIIILPVTNGLYGVYRLDSVVAVIYGFHLLAIAGLNALLWLLALRGRGNPELLATAVFPVFVFVLG